MKRRLKLSRGKQTAGLLALTALLLCLFWGFLCYPLPTEEMEFRRLERQYGVPPTQMVVHIEKKMEREETGTVAAFAHGEYFALGKSLGKFGFSVKKKKKRKNFSNKERK